MSLLAVILLSASTEVRLPDAKTYYDCPAGDAVFSDPRVSMSSQTAGNYEIRLYDQPHCFSKDGGPERRRHVEKITGVKVLQDGKEVYSQTGYNLHVGYPQPSNLPTDAVLMRPGDDISGEGLPELLISEWSGRGHCCLTFHLFRLGKAFVRLQDIPLFDADESAFVRRPGVRGLVLATWDYSDFAGFPREFDGSPAGRVFLSFDGSRFRPDLGLMKANMPKADETGKCAALFAKRRTWRQSQPMGMWYYATDLVYTGNESAAWSFLDQAWGGTAADKKKYLGEYRSRLTKSIYRQDLMQLQKMPSTAAGQDVDWTQHCLDYLRG